jgi:hypothetical protein
MQPVRKPTRPAHNVVLRMALHATDAVGDIEMVFCYFENVEDITLLGRDSCYCDQAIEVFGVSARVYARPLL